MWRERFRQMAERNRETPIIINGVEKHIERIERGREERGLKARDRKCNNKALGGGGSDVSVHSIKPFCRWGSDESEGTQVEEGV